MKLNKLFNCLGIFVLGLSAFQVAQAGGKSVYTITATTPAPSSIVSGRTAVAVYSVKNNAPITLSNGKLKNLPSTVSQATGNNLCGNPVDLGSGESCNLKLNITGAVSSSSNVPTVCDGVYCAKSPTTVNVSTVSSPTSNMPSLSSTNAITLSPGNSADITVTNDSSSVTANDINISTPSSVSDQLTTSRSGCDSVSPGGDCTITVTAKDGASGGGFPAEATIEGSNTQSTTTDLNFAGDLTVAVDSTSADKHLFYRALEVTNNSSTAGQLESVSVTGLDNKVEWCKKTGDSSCDYQSTCTLDSKIAPDGGSCLLWFKAKTPASSPKLGADSGAITVKGVSGTSHEFGVIYSLDLYVGGLFPETGGGRPLSDNIAKYNGTKWSNVGTEAGANKSVVGLTTYEGDLYAGGQFTSIGGADQANHIAKWNGSSWSALGDGVDASVTDLASLNDKLYAVGQFLHAGGESANHIAQWDGEDWSTLGTGTNNFSLALTTVNSTSTLYVGGVFTTAGNVDPANRAASWDESRWSSLGSGLNSSVLALTAIGSDVYAGGGFSEAGGNPASKIAEWDSEDKSWSSLADGLAGGNVVALTSLGSNVIAGGEFTELGGAPGNTVNNIAKWNPEHENWSAFIDADTLANGTAGAGNVLSLTSLGSNTLFAGGDFGEMGGVDDTLLIAQWDDTTSKWSALDNGLHGVRVSALKTAPSLSLS